MKKFASPEFFYKQTAPILACMTLAAAFFFCYGILAGLFIAPQDYQQNEAVRIMYIHVPTALLSLSVYTIIGVMSIVYLVWKVKLADVIAQVSAPFGAAVTFIALFSGALWGKPMWGTWWVWDARLTSELILLFLYFGYMGLRSAIRNPRVAAQVSAILAVVGLIDIPIIHFSVQWWNTLHQGASISRFAKPAIATSMLYPLLSIIVAMYLLYGVVIGARARTELLWRERGSRWVKQLMEGS